MRTEPRARAPIEAEALLSRLGMKLLDGTPIAWKQVQTTPLMLVETDRGRYVLKFRTPPSNLRSRIRGAFGDLELATQARVYTSLSGGEFEFLRFPELIDTDGRNYLLLEHVDTRPHGEHDLPRAQLLESLLEFQFADVRLAWRGPRAAMAVTRTPFALLLRRLLGGIRTRLGREIALLGVSKAFECRDAQPPLARKIVSHNDFHHNNLLLGAGGELYFSDFEAVTLEPRWVLSDIVHYATGTQQFGIDTDIIGDYYRLLSDRRDLGIDLSAQLRFGLLARVTQLMLSSVPPLEVAAQYRAFLEEVLLDDDAFFLWMAGNFELRV